MNNRTQLGLSAALVSIALVVAIGSTGRMPEAQSGTDGHDHAAMTAATEASRPVSLDAESARRIGVAYATVDSGPMLRTVRVVAAVTYDETRLVTVNPKIEGWAEKLYVNFTGAPVQRGQPLLTVHSPMLIAAQEELILAAKLVREADGGSAADNARALLEAARRRLGYWDIAPEDIARVEASGVPQKTITLRAPASGLVMEKNVFVGGRIMPGMDLYRIADLSTVWVEGEVFEKDLALVGAGRTATITFDAYAGEVFTGRVTYVYPTVSADARTGRVRIELRNPRMKFKPGMYANVTFEAAVHAAGLHVPRAAVLTTGTRSLVFVQHEDGSLVPHEVTVGQTAGDHVEIISGLHAGQVIVAQASFLVDAESNLGAAVKEMSNSGAPDPHAGH